MLSRRYVEAPAGAPLPYGLLSAAIVVDDTDPHLGMGVEYESASCGLAHLTANDCFTERSQTGGEVTVTMDTARMATLDVSGTRGEATIEWGDTSTTTDSTPDGQTHTYAADGPYTVVVTDAYGYRAEVPITVTNLAATGGGTADASLAGFPNSSDGMDVIGGDAFTVYALHSCRNVGGVDRAEAVARDKLTNGESRAIEEQLAYDVLAGAEDLTPTPGTAVAPVAGLAILERHAAANYAGVPVVHVTRDTGTVLGAKGAIGRQGSRLESVQGVPIASGGGYPIGGTVAGQTASAGQRWMYVTGTVLVRRGRVDTTEPMQSLAAPTNELHVLAHRPVVVTAECILAAVLVDAPVEATT